MKQSGTTFIESLNARLNRERQQIPGLESPAEESLLLAGSGYNSKLRAFHRAPEEPRVAISIQKGRGEKLAPSDR